MDKELLEAMERLLEPVNRRLDWIESCLMHVEARIDSHSIDRVNGDIAQIKEDCDVTRAAASELIAWTDVVSKTLPMPKIS